MTVPTLEWTVTGMGQTLGARNHHCIWWIFAAFSYGTPNGILVPRRPLVYSDLVDTAAKNTTKRPAAEPIESAADARNRLSAGAPRQLLSRAAEKRMGQRHIEVLDQLEQILQTRGFASFTIAELAAGVGCSRRTLYELASSKDQLVQVVLDRLLHKKGRAALAAVDHEDTAVDQLRAYLRGSSEIHLQASVFDDLAEDAPGRLLVDSHYRFVMTVVERIVNSGIAKGEIPTRVNATLVAAVLATAAQFVSRPEILEAVALDEDDAIDQVVDLLVPALASGR